MIICDTHCDTLYMRALQPNETPCVTMDNMKKVGAVGWKTLLFFLCTTAIACVIGLLVANVFNGLGLFTDLSGEAGNATYEARSNG